MLIPRFYYPTMGTIPLHGSYQLTVGGTHAVAHTLAHFNEAPAVDDEIALTVTGLAGRAVYRVIGIQQTTDLNVATLYLEYVRQDFSDG